MRLPGLPYAPCFFLFTAGTSPRNMSIINDHDSICHDESICKKIGFFRKKRGFCVPFLGLFLLYNDVEVKDRKSSCSHEKICDDRDGDDAEDFGYRPFADLLAKVCAV